MIDDFAVVTPMKYIVGFAAGSYRDGILISPPARTASWTWTP
jgi:hypothetical protein